jgi:ribonuclease R
LEAGFIELGVHIADVSHFLKYNTPVDRKAQEKATSVYLVEGVEHMLPKQLSENLCSLVPNEDRFAFSVFYTINPAGEITDSRFAKTIIRSDRRFTYTEVERILKEKKGTLSRELCALYTLTKKWRSQRLSHGAIEFDSEEVKIERNTSGFPTAIYTKPTLESMKLIEECMLLANKTVAEFIEKNTRHGRGTGVYRVHDGPQGEKKLFLQTILKELGKTVRTEKGKIPQSELKKVLEESSAGEKEFLRLILLRSMGKAYYTTENAGHYGLGLACYTHFTSPIRRYPDVMVHRVLNSILTKHSLGRGEQRHYMKLCSHSTDMEINAQEAERDSIKRMQVLFMSNKIGQKFSGVITGIVQYGIFVREHTTKAEGFIHARTLSNELMHHDPTRHALRDSRAAFRLGDPIDVLVDSVDPDRGFINYKLA